LPGSTLDLFLIKNFFFSKVQQGGKNLFLESRKNCLDKKQAFSSEANPTTSEFTTTTPAL
jgi:hypothetical protein